MNTVKYELKYCERCGTLKLRPVSSATNYCMLCEHLLARFRFGKSAAAAIAAGLSTPAAIKTLAGIPFSVTDAATAGRLQ